MSHPHPTEKGTARSYVVGFILSLVFTFIPYYMVTHNLLESRPLLLAIIGIALLQMVIQMLFFLHLGRERKPRWQLYFFIGTAIGVMTTVGGSIFIIDHLHKNMSPSDIVLRLSQGEGIAQVGGEKTGACQGRQTPHRVVIKNGVVTPLSTVAKRCDTLTFINEDETKREIAFGRHPRHDSYGGEDEISVRKGRPESITLNQTGTFMFHDHLRPETYGYFIVEP